MLWTNKSFLNQDSITINYYPFDCEVEMDWIKNLNRALEFIESNIEKELNNEIIAKEAYSSKFHFYRVFNILTGKTLGEYIKERRLTLASQDIIGKKMKIIDVALKYGYDDPGAFTKAFKRFHGVTPTQALTTKKILKATPPLKFFIDVKGEDQMDYRIEKKEGFSVVGVTLRTTAKDGVSFKAIPEFWQEKDKDGTTKEMCLNMKDMGILGICYDYDMDTDDFKYMIATEGNETSWKRPEKLEVPESTWAIFPGKGNLPDSMQKIWKKIFSEWLPATNYTVAEGPQLELYLSEPDENGNESFEIWVPVEQNE